MNAIEQIFGPPATSGASKPRNELGQEDFLKLMIAQLKNQDPSNPADNGEFLSQIAQFSMVSGIDDLGSSFNGIAGNLYATQAMQAAQLVGRDVLTQSETATLLPESFVEGVFSLDETATNARLLIRDMTGTLINSMSVGTVAPGSQRFAWDGVQADGTIAPPGEYVISAEGLVNGELVALPVEYFNRVESVSVDRELNSVLLHLANGTQASFSQVNEFK